MFSPVNVNIARQLLNLPSDKQIILIGAQSITDFYKGFDLFLQAIKEIDLKDIHIVSFGRNIGSHFSSLDVSYTSLGFLADMLSLRLVYSAADVFVAPSRMDAFGKTLAEAHACGTPVVCFDATGPKDIVEHQVTGYKAKLFNPIDLARGIKWILSLSKERHNDMRIHSRERAVHAFDSCLIAKQYKKLYEEVVS